MRRYPASHFNSAANLLQLFPEHQSRIPVNLHSVNLTLTLSAFYLMLHLLNFFSNFNSQQLLAFLKSQDLIISVTFLCQKQHKPLNMALKSASEDK